MIRINLATRKTSGAAVAEQGSQTLASRFSTKFTSLSTGMGSGAETVRDLPLAKYGVVVVLCIIANMALDSYKKDQVAAVQAKIDKETATGTKLATDYAQTKPYEAIKKTLDQDELTIKTKLETVKTLIDGRTNTKNLLTVISNGIPADVWLKDFAVTEDGVTIKGNSLDSPPISDFMKNLSESSYLTDVKLLNQQQAKDELNADTWAFDLSAKKRKGN